MCNCPETLIYYDCPDYILLLPWPDAWEREYLHSYVPIHHFASHVMSSPWLHTTGIHCTCLDKLLAGTIPVAGIHCNQVLARLPNVTCRVTGNVYPLQDVLIHGESEDPDAAVALVQSWVVDHAVPHVTLRRPRRHHTTLPESVWPGREALPMLCTALHAGPGVLSWQTP